MQSDNVDYILFAQHGWADTNVYITRLAKSLATKNSLIICPNLGWWKTWLNIEPLVQQVEQIATEVLTKHPNVPVRIIGHSMGGLIWLEVLHRNPQWHFRIHSLVLIASPVGGADLARIIDTLGLKFGIAADLGKNRRAIAEKIARVIPTLAIAGDFDKGSDGTITIGSTQFSGSQFVCLSDINHAAMKYHSRLLPIIRDFWANPLIPEISALSRADQIIKRLQAVSGMTDAHRRDLMRSQVNFTCECGTTIRTWKNPLGVDHVFVADSKGKFLYGGFVGWLHSAELRQTLKELKQEYAAVM